LACFENNEHVRIRLILGAAGSGKTFRCLTEAREALVGSPDGLPMLLIAPKQGTYQLEQQLLEESSLAGYTRLRIVSFESLADFILNRLRKYAPKILDEEGRVMVLRHLLVTRRESLKVFRASARLTGFAQQLSPTLRELQGQQVTPPMLESLAAELGNSADLAAKLQDLAALLESYLGWLNANKLQDADSLLCAAAEALRATAQPRSTDERGFETCLRFSRIWIDGFAEYSERELDLLESLLPLCEEASMTFCLDPAHQQKQSWLSHWSMVNRTYERCRKRLGSTPGAEVEIEHLGAGETDGRFAKSSALQHLAECWGSAQPFQTTGAGSVGSDELQNSLRLAVCANPEAEARIAAREILRHVRAGGRYRDIAVIVRQLEGYHSVLQRLFLRYGIPFFLDRRESVAHHPLAELTRSAIRTVALGWRHEDWFAALKSGLMRCPEKDVDLLENEALARGWSGVAWLRPIRLKEDAKTEQDQKRLQRLEAHLEKIRREAVLPFEKLMLTIGEAKVRISGPRLAGAIRDFWQTLRIQECLGFWNAAEPSDPQLSGRQSVHETVWNQVNAWLDNAELAFPEEILTLREWLPILEAGLANLTVGIIPPALDQVLIGAIDRSRTPNIKLALVLGLNETIFPALPTAGGLLNEADRLELERRGVVAGSTTRQHLSRERYLAYIACTRPCERLVVTCSLQDSQGVPLNQSAFLSHLRRLFPSVELETETASVDWQASEHVTELTVPLLKMSGISNDGLKKQRSSVGFNDPTADAGLLAEPAFDELSRLIQQIQQLQSPYPDERLAPELAARLYGPTLRSSVSRMERFAACPFQFFVHSGLRAEERKLFELDVKEQGTFQHDVLAWFHQELHAEGKRWRDITPEEARNRIAGLGKKLTESYHNGLLQASEQTRFVAGVLTESLQDFVEILVGWMRDQYLFDPVAVELGFGTEENYPAWAIALPQGHTLELYGRIDRIDLHKQNADEALCVVIDYKSSQKQLDPVLIANGLQLQLLTYLSVLRHWPISNGLFGVRRLIPAGVFYVNLRGRYDRQSNRSEVLANLDSARRQAYQHTGRFDEGALRYLDKRPGVQQGDQFNFRITNSGRIHKGCREALTTDAFEALLHQVEDNLQEMGTHIFSGVTAVSPYRKGGATACVQCSFGRICRVDPWTQPFRVLRAKLAPREVSSVEKS
jgi:ATP-dependent helicase/nuclease subunit B